MKLLLTSAGIKNKTLAQAVLDLAGKKAEELTVAFIPTAANADGNDKTWFIDNLYQLKQQGYKTIDIVDISALPKWNWQKRLENADVLFFSGGNSAHLIRWIEESGLKELLPELLQIRVWVGVSAGSVVTAPIVVMSSPDRLSFYKEKFGYEADKGLALVDFYTRPHLNSSKFPNVRKEILMETTKDIPGVVYAIDDQMAIKVVDGKIEVIGEGEYLVFNKK
ncbi:MAG: Type 1 glutamine amidotransferase-like domain-containing protein [Candidatus Parcubacteria bacterium]|nr:Type 1 glutamine amidotransferase-like domain-containing protein [Candidatus Parcubacteria bacterium]